MALKYQALNGTVISKTTTIQGTDIAKRGTPQLLGGITTTEGHVFPFSGLTSNITDPTTTIYSSSSISAAAYNTIKSVVIDGVTYVGFPSSRYYFASYEGSSPNTYNIDGKFIIVKASATEGIIVEEYNVNFSIKPDTSQNRSIVLYVAKQPDDVILSITFEPTE